MRAGLFNNPDKAPWCKWKIRNYRFLFFFLVYNSNKINSIYETRKSAQLQTFYSQVTSIDNSSNILEGLNSILNYIETIESLSED